MNIVWHHKNHTSFQHFNKKKTLPSIDKQTQVKKTISTQHLRENKGKYQVTIQVAHPVLAKILTESLSILK